MQDEIAGNSVATQAGGFTLAQRTTQLSGGRSGEDFNAFAGFLLDLPQTAGKMYIFPQVNFPGDLKNKFSIRATAIADAIAYNTISKRRPMWA